MSTHIVIQFRSAITEQYTNDLHFWIDGRWAPRTTRAKMLEAVREHKAARLARDIYSEPVRAVGYWVLGKGDSVTHPMPFVESNQFEWTVKTPGGAEFHIFVHLPRTYGAAKFYVTRVGSSNPLTLTWGLTNNAHVATLEDLVGVHKATETSWDKKIALTKALDCIAGF